MEDFIPLIILIAISIIGMIGRKKQRRIAQEQPEYEQQPENDDLFGWLEKIAVDEEPDVSVKKETVSPTPAQAMEQQANAMIAKQTKPADNKYKAYSGIISSEESNWLKERINRKGKYEDDKKADILEIEELEIEKYNFDLRQAVIFSEVLNRKYE